MFLLLPIACFTFPETVQMTATVFDAYGDDANPVAGATLSSRNANLELVDEGTTDDQGQITLMVGASQAVFLVLDGDGYAPTAITGLSGADDFTVPDGGLWMRTDAERDALIDEFAGCSQPDGAIVEGDVRFFLPVTDPVDTWPTVSTATVTVQYADDSTVSACYLDDKGVSAPDAEQTGLTGRFAVFGLDSGPITLLVEAQIDEDNSEQSLYIGWLPEDGVLPKYSAIITVD